MSHKTLTRSGYIVQKKYLTNAEMSKVRKDLTVTPLVLPAFKDIVKPKPYKVYLESPERLFLPRYYGIGLFGESVNTNISEGLSIDITVHMTLRPHQLPAAKNIMKQFNKPFVDPTLPTTTTATATTATTATTDPTVDPILITDPTDPNNGFKETEGLEEGLAEGLGEADDLSLVKNGVGGGGVLSLPCGYGKTVLAIWTIAQLKKKTLVVVNKEFLMDQWIDSFDKFSNARVGILQQNKIEIDGNDVVVAMLHSICMKDYPKGIFDEFGLVIFDECHHIASDMFSKALPKVATKYMLGLSATPERKDGLSRVFYYYLGKLFHQERRAGSNLVVVKQIHCMSSSPYYQELYLKNGVKNTGGMLTQLIEFEERNRMIVYILSLLVKQSRTTLVLSSRREHLEWIYNSLQKANLRRPNGTFVTFGLYWGKQQMNKKQYKKMLEESAKCDIVLGTCQLAQEGLDIPTLDTILFATPMTDVVQAVGRILRKYHSVNPYVIDIVDKFGNFPKHLKQRQAFYDDEEYFCEKTNTILYDDPKDNKYEELLAKFLETIPDLTEFEAQRGQAIRRRPMVPRPFRLEDDVDDRAFDEEEEGDPLAIRLPLGCLLESASSGFESIPNTKIPVKITPKLPSLANKMKVPTATSSIPKVKVSDTIVPSVNPKVKVSDTIVPSVNPKVKVSERSPSPPKVKVSERVVIIPKLKVEVAQDKTEKLKVSEIPIQITPKIKIGDRKEQEREQIQNQKIKMNPVGVGGDMPKIKVETEGPVDNPNNPKIKVTEAALASKQVLRTPAQKVLPPPIQHKIGRKFF